MIAVKIALLPDCVAGKTSHSSDFMQVPIEGILKVQTTMSVIFIGYFNFEDSFSA